MQHCINQNKSRWDYVEFIRNYLGGVQLCYGCTSKLESILENYGLIIGGSPDTEGILNYVLSFVVDDLMADNTHAS